MVVLTHISNNLARLLSLRIAFNLDETTIMASESLTGFSHEIIDRSEKYFGIKIKYKNTEYGFDVFIDSIDTLDPTMFAADVKKLPVQVLVNSKKSNDVNEWNISDLYCDQISATQWVNCSLMKDTLPQFNRIKELSNFKVPGISIREVPCTLLSKFTQKNLPTGSFIIFYYNCAGYHEFCRRVENHPNKPNIGS